MYTQYFHMYTYLTLFAALKWLFGDEFDVLTVARHLPPAVSGTIIVFKCLFSCKLEKISHGPHIQRKHCPIERVFSEVTLMIF